MIPFFDTSQVMVVKKAAGYPFLIPLVVVRYALFAPTMLQRTVQRGPVLAPTRVFWYPGEPPPQLMPVDCQKESGPNLPYEDTEIAWAVESCWIPRHGRPGEFRPPPTGQVGRLAPFEKFRLLPRRKRWSRSGELSKCAHWTAKRIPFLWGPEL